MMNPADESALELALRLRPPQGTVTVFSVGPVEADRLLQDALAAGADAAVRVWDDDLASTQAAGDRDAAGGGAAGQRRCPIWCCAAVIAWIADRARCRPCWPNIWIGRSLTDVTQFEQSSYTGTACGCCGGWIAGRGPKAEVTLPAILGLETGLVHLRQASLPSLDAGQTHPDSAVRAGGIGIVAAGFALSRDDLA
jgi:hypothetical protein